MQTLLLSKQGMPYLYLLHKEHYWFSKIFYNKFLFILLINCISTNLIVAHSFWKVYQNSNGCFSASLHFPCSHIFCYTYCVRFQTNKLGVCCVRVEKGMTLEKLRMGLSNFAKTSATPKAKSSGMGLTSFAKTSATPKPEPTKTGLSSFVNTSTAPRADPTESWVWSIAQTLAYGLRMPLFSCLLRIQQHHYNMPICWVDGLDGW